MLARCARCQNTFTTDHYGRQTCPHCGSELLLADPNEPQPTVPAGPSGLPPPPPGGPGWAPPPPGSGWTPPSGAEPGPEAPSPFAERSTRGFFRSFFETWKLVATQPQRFFGRVRIDQTGTAIFFGVLAATVGGVLEGLFRLATAGSLAAQLRAQLADRLSQMPAQQAVLAQRLIGSLLWFNSPPVIRGWTLLTPLGALVFIFAAAALSHLFLLIFGAARRGFRATLTVVAFAQGVSLVAAVPQCGTVVAIVWELVVLIIGLAAIHRTDVWRAAVAVLVPAFLTCCCCSGTLAAAVTSIAVNAGPGDVTNL